MFSAGVRRVALIANAMGPAKLACDDQADQEMIDCPRRRPDDEAQSHLEVLRNPRVPGDALVVGDVQSSSSGGALVHPASGSASSRSSAVGGSSRPTASGG